MSEKRDNPFAAAAAAEPKPAKHQPFQHEKQLNLRELVDMLSHQLKEHPEYGTMPVFHTECNGMEPVLTITLDKHRHYCLIGMIE